MPAGWRAWVVSSVVALLAAVGVGVVLSPASASAFGGIEQITTYDVGLTVTRDGGLDVRETIDYDFGDQQRHGIHRELPTRSPMTTTVTGCMT